MNDLPSNTIHATMHPPFDVQRTNRTPDRQGTSRRALRIALLQLALTASACAAAATVAAADPPSLEHHPGKFVFAELVTPDLAAAKQFYGGLFGWRFRDDSAGRGQHAEATIDGRPVAGLAQRTLRAGEPGRPAWLSFIAVTDMEATRKTAVANGARVLSAARGVPGRGGQAAVFADPQGAVFGVLAATDGDPPDVLADPGEWIWCSLLTQDPDAGAAFYQMVFDYDVFELPAEGDRQHLLLASEDYARGSVNTEPRSGTVAHPHWLHYVRVGDASAMVARAVALGGRVLVEPKLDRQGGKVAVVADPQGAPIGLLEWPGSDERAAAP